MGLLAGAVVASLLTVTPAAPASITSGLPGPVALPPVSRVAATVGQPAAWSAPLKLKTVSVSTVAGNATSAVTDGVGTAASFKSPTGLAIADGVGYTIDTGYVRSIDLATGRVTIVAGRGEIGCADGTVAYVGTAGNSAVTDGNRLYWMDTCTTPGTTADWKVRWMSLATGEVGTYVSLRFVPNFGALTLGPDGGLYFSDLDANKQLSLIKRIDTATGAVTTTSIVLPELLNPQDGLKHPQGITSLAADSQSLWVLSAFGSNTSAALDRVDFSTGAVTVVVQNPQITAVLPGPMIGSGDCLYLGWAQHNASSGLGFWPKDRRDLVNVDPAVGTTLSGDGGRLDVSTIKAMDVSGNALYVLANGRLHKLVATGAGGPARLLEHAGGGNIAESDAGQPSHGEPVDLATGTLWSRTTDVAVPGRSVPLAFARAYDSGRAATAGRLGYGWTDSYDWLLTVDNAGLVTVRQDNGAQTVFTPNPMGGYDAPSRVQATLSHNADGTWTYLLRNTLTYAFNDAGKLTAVKDRNGNTTSLTYGPTGRLGTVTDPAGRYLELGYDASNRIVTVTDPLLRKVTYTYDPAGNLATVTDLDARVTTFGYDAAHRLTTVKDPRGNTMTNVYDPTTGKVTQQTDRRGKITGYAYTAPAADSTWTTTVTHPRGGKDVYTFANENMISLTQGSGTADATTTTYTYDPVTNAPASVTDGAGHTSKATYDTAGNKLTATDALGRTTTWTYNALNEPLTATDPAGVTTTNAYDAAGNPLTVSTPLAGTTQVATTTFTHGDAAHPGDITAVTDPLGKTTSFTYDANGNQTSVTDPTGRKTTTSYNPIGWTTSVVLPAGNAAGATATGHTVTYGSFTGFGTAKTVTDPLGKTTTYAFDADQNLTDVTDPDGRHTVTTYDGENHPTLVTRPDASTQASGYDDDGNLATQTDGLTHATSYTYDVLDRPTAVTDALARKTTYTYDTTGRLATVTAPAATGTGTVTTTNTYDAADQLTGTSYSDGVTPAVSYTYDALGRRATMVDGTGTTTYTTDSLGRLTKVVNGAGKAVSYTYDLANRPIGITYPGTLGTVTRGYDDAGRLTSVKDWLGKTSAFGYDPDGNWTTTSYGNTVTGTRTYNSAGQLLTIGYAKGTTALGTYTYTRTGAGLLASTTPSAGATGTTDTHAYTANGQLKSVTGATSTTVWGYDAADRLTKLPTGATLTYDVADQLTKLTPTTGSATTYTYDQRGNRTTSKTGTATAATYTYDQANRLTTYTNPTGTKTTYTYNGDGLRAAKTTGTTAATMTWDPIAGLPLLLNDTTTSHLYGPAGTPLEQIRGTTATYLHGDQLDSTILITSATGTAADRYAYNPYGTVTAHSGTTNTALQYNGQYTDTETGHLYLRARYYDPTTTQFLTVDPLAALTRQRYAYALGNPLAFTDPAGLDAIDTTGNFITGVADGMSLGLGPLARHALSINFTGCGTAHTTGNIVGTIATTIPGGIIAGAARGTEAGIGALRAANVGEDAIPVFRVHGPEETADIVGSGVYRNPPGLEGKYFYPTRAQTENLGGMYSKAGIGGPYSVSSGTVSRTVLNQAERIAPAGEGPAFFFRNDLLPNITNVTVHGPL